MRPKGKRRQDDVLLMALACGATVEAAARNASLAESTVYRRLNEPEFQRRLRQIRDDMVQRTAALLTAAATEAVKTLLSLQDASTPPPVRLGAARAIIELGGKLRESSELAERIKHLEEQMVRATTTAQEIVATAPPGPQAAPDPNTVADAGPDGSTT